MADADDDAAAAAAKALADRERLNAAVKDRLAEVLALHVHLCPICLLRGVRACETGNVLYQCTLHGLDTKPEHVRK